MGKTVKITCDQCGEDITDTGLMPKCRIVIHSERLPHTTNERYAISAHDPVPTPLYFCSWACMELYITVRK